MGARDRTTCPWDWLVESHPEYQERAERILSELPQTDLVDAFEVRLSVMGIGGLTMDQRTPTLTMRNVVDVRMAPAGVRWQLKAMLDRLMEGLCAEKDDPHAD